MNRTPKSGFYSWPIPIIGIDWPQKPRVRRRRRGDDFYNNNLSALKSAFEKQVDLVVYGGDLLHRSRLPEYVIHRAFEPLLQVADLGVPVYVVPGNHERSVFRRTLFERHPPVLLFDHPKVYQFEKEGIALSLCGCPFYRGNIRSMFPELMKKITPRIDHDKTILLCLHHPFDGAKVGPKSFTFYNRADTINPTDTPEWIDVILSGYFHRRQVLRFRKNIKQIPLYYTGSS
jgi:hypothetical protein